MNRKKICIILIFIALTLATSYLILPKNAAEAAPPEILGFPGKVISEGVEAIESVKQKHVGKVENVEDMAIVQYGPVYHPIILWVTLYPSEEMAASENEKMADAMIAYGGGWAENLEEITVDGKKTYKTSPNGAHHYFWAEEEYVFYVIIPPSLEGRTTEIINAI